ncbi:unnamed protein product [Didymodactylos carnosus]|uniref:Uncharacterized protein n=1 Tax=Didymodactylos carnosus TaxID=1234261 RepID=A0A8S2DFP7_9BILA|nr:unnamed protein product [Didymodactylos carnosus]CAF3688909.1 unnamed protein product [Didymodactylos carnosus]
MTQPTWISEINKIIKDEKLKCATCNNYNSKQTQSQDGYEKCGCSRLIRNHSFDGICKTEPTPKDRWSPQNNTARTPVNTYGFIFNKAKVKTTWKP